MIAFYFTLMLMSQDWPILVGPYEEWEQCASVREFLDRRGYDTGACEPMSLGQEARHLEVIDLP